jgi:hypothetical protein
MTFNEKCMWEQKIGGVKKWVRGCESGCGGNCNEPTCCVKAKE